LERGSVETILQNPAEEDTFSLESTNAIVFTQLIFSLIFLKNVLSSLLEVAKQQIPIQQWTIKLSSASSRTGSW